MNAPFQRVLVGIYRHWMSALRQQSVVAQVPLLAGLRRSPKVCSSIRRGLSSTHFAVSIGGGIWAQSQVVENVGDVPTAVDDTDNLDDAGTLTVEDQILAVRKQP